MTIVDEFDEDTVEVDFAGRPVAPTEMLLNNSGIPERNPPIPSGWEVIAYREPEPGEQYFSERLKDTPWKASNLRLANGKLSGVTDGKKWIVVRAGG